VQASTSLEPRYQSGWLVYNDFGRDMLDRLDEVGFDTEVVRFASTNAAAASLLSFCSVQASGERAARARVRTGHTTRADVAVSICSGQEPRRRAAHSRAKVTERSTWPRMLSVNRPT
jgi:hypothetical protein